MAIPLAILKAYNGARKCCDKGSICHAPSTSMYFGQNGVVSACCYSRRNPLGRFPDQSIAELWSGQKIKEMRVQMRGQLLPNGCEICADQLRAGNFMGLLATQFDEFALTQADTGAIQYPSRMEFELSNKCNLECAMCSGFFSSSIRSSRERLPVLPQMYDRSFTEQLRPFIPHLREAKFFGGEPFLIDMNYEIWELFIALNPSCHIAITTNGTVYTEKVERVLENLNSQIIVSIDSLRKETYESIRVNARFERTMANLEVFMEINRKKGRPLGLAVCPMVNNWRELPEMVEFANRGGFGLYFNTVDFPRELSLKFLPIEEQEAIVDFLKDARWTPSNEIEEHNFRSLEDLCYQVELWIRERASYSVEGIRNRCAAYLERFQKSDADRQADRFLVLLSVLAAKNTADRSRLVTPEGFGEDDLVRNFSEYMADIWRVGSMLAADGVMSGARFMQSDLEEFCRVCAEELPAATLQNLCRLAKLNPLQVLQATGVNSPRELVSLAKVYAS